MAVGLPKGIRQTSAIRSGNKGGFKRKKGEREKKEYNWKCKNLHEKSPNSLVDVVDGSFTYNIKTDDIYQPTKAPPRDIRTLKTHVKCHFENEVHLKNGYDWQEKENLQM